MNDPEKVETEVPAEEADTEAQANQDFESGFTYALTGEEPPTTPGDEAGDGNGGDGDEGVQTDTGGDDDAGDAAVETGDDSASPVSITLDQVSELLESRLSELKDSDLRSIQGRYGELKSKLDEINEKLTAAPEGGQAAAEPRKIGKEEFKRLSEEYEDLAEALAEDLSGLLPSAPAAPEFDKEALVKELSENLTASFEERLADTTAEQNERFLNYISPGWDEKVASEEYGSYLESLPAAEREKIESSDDPVFVAESVKAFDAWAKNQKAAAGKADANKQKRLEDAEQPTKGGTGGGKTEDPNAAFEAGFKEVMRPL